MTVPERRFLPPWSIEEPGPYFIVRAALAGSTAGPLKRLPVRTQVVRRGTWHTNSQRA